MSAKYILLAVGSLFLIAAFWRFAASGWQVVPAVRTWLLIGVIFLAVALWLLNSR
jgi:hypothetical protein